MFCTIIGYHGGFPGKNEACSGYLIQQDETNLLLDCGSGVVSNLQNVLDPNLLHDIVISHEHADHVSDCGVLQYFRLVHTQLGLLLPPLRFYAPKEMKHYSDLQMPPYSTVFGLTELSKLQIGPFSLQFLKTVHPVMCLAVRVSTKDKSIVYTADGSSCSQLVEFAKHADLLLCECSLYADKNGEASGHMNSTQAATLASQAQVKRLILSHLPSYGNHMNLLEEAKQHYLGQVELAQNLMRLEV